MRFENFNSFAIKISYFAALTKKTFLYWIVCKQLCTIQTLGFPQQDGFGLLIICKLIDGKPELISGFTILIVYNELEISLKC